VSTRLEDIAECLRGFQPGDLDGACVVVHRDLGREYAHTDEPSCPCAPTCRVVLPGTGPEELAAEIERAERESEA